MTETETLFTSLLKCDRAALYLDRGRRLTGEQSAFVSSVLRRRAAGEPLEYILGTCEFMGLELKVNPCVLIPRPETEILVETALRYAAGGALSVADVCTGSGNIAVSLAKSLPSATIIAIDISSQALGVAAANAAANGCGGRVNFVRGDLLVPLQGQAPVDMIVSNPPYVARGDIPRLQAEVRREPALALDGGEDGLDFYRALAGGSGGCLRRGGVLLMEVGFGQASAVRDLLAAKGDFGEPETIRDYNGIERVVAARKR